MPDLKSLTPEDLAAIAALDLDYQPDHSPKGSKSGGWLPDLNPTQKLIFDDPTPYILAHGERGSGKSLSVLHKMVRHCYENFAAMALIITPHMRAGSLGVVDDLATLVLPAWTEGIGLEWLPPKVDAYTKDKIIKVANRYGGWSTIIQISIPYESAIEARFKNLKPSFIMVDEVTDLEGSGYFYKTIAELNRRRGIEGPQQWCGTCNPKGPDHWLYPIFFVKNAGNPKYKTYHVPLSENSHRPEMAGYLETLTEACKDDPILADRWIRGLWVEYPTGEGIYKGFYIPKQHVVGSVRDGTGLVPVKGFPCTIGYDIGQVHNAAVFEQFVYTQEGPMLLVFDELVSIRAKVPYEQLALDVINTILEWNDLVGDKLVWEHITDDSAVNQYRPGTGSYDAWEFQKVFNAACEQYQLPPMTMVGCPKGKGSKEARVRAVQNRLRKSTLLVSDRCERVKAMFLNLEHTEENPLEPKKTAAGHIHVHDALSYPVLYFDLNGTPNRECVIKAVKTY